MTSEKSLKLKLNWESLNLDFAASLDNISLTYFFLYQVALLKGGWNELLIAGFAHRSLGIQNGEII